MKTFTPLMINMMIHHYTSSAMYSGSNLAHAGSDAVRQQTDFLLSKDLLAEDLSRPSGLTTTARANFLINHILSLPIPEPKWAMPEQKDSIDG